MSSSRYMSAWQKYLPLHLTFFCRLTVSCPRVHASFFLLSFFFFFLFFFLFFLLLLLLFLFFFFFFFFSSPSPSCVPPTSKRITAYSVALLHPALSYVTYLQLTLPISLMSFSSSCFQLVLSLPLGRLWSKLAWYIVLVCRVNVLIK